VTGYATLGDVRTFYERSGQFEVYDRVGHIRPDYNRLGHVRTGWDRLGHVR